MFVYQIHILPRDISIDAKEEEEMRQIYFYNPEIYQGQSVSFKQAIFVRYIRIHFRKCVGLLFLMLSQILERININLQILKV